MRYIVTLLAALGVLATWSGSWTRAEDDAKTFFNGKNLDGWEGLIDKFWSVKDGAIVGTAGDQKIPFNTFLCSKRKFKDFELSFQVRLKDAQGNSGVQIRSEILNPERFSVKGPQCDIGWAGGTSFWGSLYGEEFGGMMKQAPAEIVDKALKPKEFNDYSIKCVGKHVTIKLNGATTVDDDFPKMPDEGIIAWQLHGGNPMEVTFKNVKFKDLSAK